MGNHSIQINQWLKDLSAIRHENAMFKITLSELVDKSVMTDFLTRAEKIHNELIANDETVRLLIDTANHIQSKLNNGNPGMYTHYLAKKQQLDHDLKIFENRFRSLKKRFQDDLLGHQPAGVN